MAAAATVEDPALWTAAATVASHLHKPGQFDEVKRLLDMGADIEAKGGSFLEKHLSTTPLWAAAGNGSLPTVQLLLDKGADVSGNANDGSTPLHHASGWGNEAVVELLLDKGAEVSAKDSTGCLCRDVDAEGIKRMCPDHHHAGVTPLHVAAVHNRKAVVQLLMQRGAEVLATTNAGQTPEDMATRNGRRQIATMLKAEALRRAQCEAFAMGQHERLGAGSWVQELEPGVVQMVVAATRDVWRPQCAGPWRTR